MCLVISELGETHRGDVDERRGARVCLAGVAGLVGLVWSDPFGVDIQGTYRPPTQWQMAK